MSNLLMVTHNFAPRIGGIENFTLGLARALSRSGLGVHVIAPGCPGDRAFDAGEPYRVERYAAQTTKDVDLVRRLERELRGGAKNVMCMQWTAAAPWLAARRVVVGKPEVFAVQCYGKELLASFKSPVPRPAIDWLERRTLAAATHVFAISEFTAGLAREHGGGDGVHLVRPGVDAARFASAVAERSLRQDDASGIRLLSVARLVPRKGIDMVIRALPAVRAQHADVRYHVVGDGPDRQRLERLARELGVADRVAFLGRIDDDALRREYAASDLFALPSRLEAGGMDVEGFGMVCLEAQAAGLPVVAGRSGGVPDALIDGETGLLVDPESATDLAQAIHTMLSDRRRLAGMAEAALAHARASSWDASARLVVQALGL